MKRQRPRLSASCALLLTTALMSPAALAQRAQRDVSQPTPSARAAEPTGTATLGGLVVADGVGTPIRMAYVVLVGTDTGVLKVTSTDDDGRFVFTGLPTDRYSLGASKRPYLGAVAGARRPARPGTPIALPDGATIDTVTIRLPMSSAISGRVIDEHGKPAPDVTVRVQQRRMQNGEPVLVTVPDGTVTSDDRGAYRVYGLVPGEYIVSALPHGGGGHTRVTNIRALSDSDVDAALAGAALGAPPPPPAQPLTYTPIYFPGTTRAADAVAVPLATGEDRGNVDLQLQLIPTSTIQGTVTDAQGRPVTSLRMTLTDEAANTTTHGTASSGRRAGWFTLSGVAPGSYQLLAQSTRDDDPQFAQVAVDVYGRDITGVQLQLQPMLSLRGQIAFVGEAAPPPVPGQTVWVRAVSPTTATPSARAVTTEDGRFSIDGLLPGDYVIGSATSASDGSGTWGLTSVTVSGQDLTDHAVTLSSTAPPTDVRLTFSDQWQSLTGRISNAANDPVDDVTVMVFPVDETYWLYESRRILSMRPSTDGHFAFGGPGPALLPAGEYYLAAVTDVSKDEEYDPAFLRTLIDAAIKVTVRAGQRQTQDLVVR